MKSIDQLRFILTKDHKKELLFITILLFFGMLLEMGGIGILLPIISFFLSAATFAKYSHLLPQILQNQSQNTLVIIGFSFVISFYLAKSLFLIYLSYRQSKFTANLSVHLSDKLFRGYLNMDYTLLLNRNSSDLIKNIQIEILHFGGISLAAMSLCTEISAIIGISTLLIFVQPYGSISVIIFFGTFSFFFNKITNSKIKRLGLERQLSDQITNKQLTEGLSGAKEIKILGVADYFSNIFHDLNITKSKIHAKIQVLNSIPRLYLELLAVLGVSVLIIVISLTSQNTEALIPIIGLFVASAFRLIPSINKIINSLQTISYTKPVLDVLCSELNLINKNEINVEVSNHKVNFENCIQIRKLNFKYPNTDKFVLENVNFEISKGNFVGFIGKTGSGKSTLINIIIGLLSPDSGAVLIDGIDISNNLRNWQKLIGYVPQHIYLTDDTILKNIAFGISDVEIDYKKIEIAIEQAQLIDFIYNLPDRLNTIVGERGVKLSGGERQRIGIARALYHNSPVIVLDEATSALDVRTESELMKSINSLHKIKTIIIIAHRLSTLEQCANVYELSEGKLEKIK